MGEVLQEGSKAWPWHDGRIRYLLEYLYGNRPEMPEEEGATIQKDEVSRRD